MESILHSQAFGGMPVHVHPWRDAVLDEVHARPFRAAEAPSSFLRLAFVCTADEAQADWQALAALCRRLQQPEPEAGSRHHVLRLERRTLRWERHSEFVTHTYERQGHADAGPADLLPYPGLQLVAVRLDLLSAVPPETVAATYDDTSLAMSLVDDGGAVAMTDFRRGADGFIRYSVIDLGLTPLRSGAVCQRLLELETYRAFALLGLPEAQRHAPTVKRIEDALAAATNRMTTASGLTDNRILLDELTSAAAELEAGSAAAAFRFSASRAYDGLVQSRLKAIGETPIAGRQTIAAFLDRRMAPALRTCQAIEDRQVNLSQKLARAANLLRTRVDIELEGQNRDLLAAMNERAQQQLRLQQTVEGLSVAAISYYIVGLFGYVAKAAKDAGIVKLDPNVAMGIAVPFVVVAVAFVIRRIRRPHD